MCDAHARLGLGGGNSHLPLVRWCAVVRLREHRMSYVGTIVGDRPRLASSRQCSHHQQLRRRDTQPITSLPNKIFALSLAPLILTNRPQQASPGSSDSDPIFPGMHARAIIQ
jgi:hypothetical protein